MANVQQGTDRFFLGKLEISGRVGEPQEPPHEQAEVIENICVVPIGPDVAGEGERRMKRFHVVELDVVFGGLYTGCTIVPYRSRKVPSPTTPYVNAPSDADTDTWQSTGGQPALKVPTASGGNVLQFRMNGAQLMAFKVLDLVGASGTITVYAYGVMVGAEGF